MRSYFAFVKANIWKLLIAFFLARFGSRLFTAVFAVVPLVDNYLIIAVIALALQGVFFGIIFCAIKTYPQDAVFCLICTVITVTIGFAFVWIAITGLVSPIWALAGVPLTFAALSAAAMRVRPAPPPPTPW